MTDHDTPWHELAECLGADTEIFYAHEEAKNARIRNERAQPAFDLCRACPVRTQCLDDALRAPGAQHGIRGGTYARTRTEILLTRRYAS